MLGCGALVLFSYRALKPKPTNAVPFGEWSQYEEIRVRVDRVKIGTPKPNPKSRVFWAEKELIQFVLRIENTSPVKRTIWSPPGNLDAGGKWDDGSLVDEHGNSFHFETVEGGWQGGLSGTEQLDPGSPAIFDVVCFEKPMAVSNTLKLTVRSSIGSHKHHFIIPASHWK